VCTTSGCVLAASELIHNLSPNYKEIDPCNDFRAFVCEGWDLKNDLREEYAFPSTTNSTTSDEQTSQSDAFTGTLMHEASQVLLRHLLESRSTTVISAKEDPSAIIDQKNFEKIQNAYDACMAESIIKEKGSAPLIEILLKLDEIFPGTETKLSHRMFPTMKTQQQKGLFYNGETPLSNAMSSLMSIGVDAIMSFGVSADDKDPDSTVVFLTPPYQHGLPSKEYYNDTKVMSMYKSTIGQVLDNLLAEAKPNSTIFQRWFHRVAVGSEPHTANDALLDALISFETKLAEASPDPEDAQDVTKYYNPRTLEETRALLPTISIPYLISQRAPGLVPNKIIVGSPSYLKTVNKLLQDTKRDTVQAYLAWKIIQAYGVNIQSDAVKPLLRFNNQLRGKDPDVTEERWRTCVKHVDNGLGWILSRVYIENAFSEAAKNFGDMIVSDIKSQFIKKLDASEWMTGDVRELAINKVHNIVQKIGYPTKSPDIRDPSVLQRYYAMVEVSNETYFENIVSMAEADVDREWAKAGKPTDRDEWGMTASTVNAYYNPAGNEIVFPAGIMQSPVFYDPTIPQYLSYGAFGSVSGHELSHAFDSSGRHYDQNGNYTGWWDNSTIQAFKGKAQCFVDQYEKFTVPGLDDKPLHVNGYLTLGENIADAGGLTASFQAWKERDQANPGELLPGLQDFTKDQLFFISYGNWWCGKTRKEEAVNRIFTDPHSPTFARILVSTTLASPHCNQLKCFIGDNGKLKRVQRKL
jgi:endothelin-converting enzyme